MKPLHCLACVFLFAMLTAAVVRWLHNPVLRERITPVSLDYRIPINHADIATLSLLSGISEKIGQYIIDHRTTHGPIRTPAELDEVPRLGPVTIEKILPYVTFEE